MKIPQVSVIIVTKNRVEHLLECLASLAVQSVKPDEVIVIDNNSSDLTASAIKKFSQGVNFPVKRYLEKRDGYPVIYNMGIKQASFKWVAFIDDDCVADIHWLDTIKKSITDHSQVAAILGHSQTYHSQNVYSLATYLFDQDWKKKNLEGKKVLNFEILDNKNIVYSKSFLDQHKIRFDEKRVHLHNGAAEDADLGLQIQLSGGMAIFVARIVVKHKDPITWTHFFMKRFVAFAAYLDFQEKWSCPKTSSTRKIKFRQVITQVLNEHPSTIFFQARLILLVSFTVFISLVLENLLHFPKFKDRYLRRF